MTLQEFKQSLSLQSPPAGMSTALIALWYDAAGRWNDAHATAQSMDDPTGAWIHAYLHRKEGDLSNAAYWYRRAGKPMEQNNYSIEFETILSAILDPGSS